MCCSLPESEDSLLIRTYIMTYMYYDFTRVSAWRRLHHICSQEWTQVSVHLASLFSCWQECRGQECHTSLGPHANVPRPSRYLLTLRMCNKITRGSESFTPHADAVCSCDTRKQTHNINKTTVYIKWPRCTCLNYEGNPQSTELPAQTVELSTYMFPKY